MATTPASKRANNSSILKSASKEGEGFIGHSKGQFAAYLKVIN